MMDRYGLPRGLISYDSSSNIDAKTKGLPPKTKIIRARTIIYTVLLTAIAVVMVFALATRKTVDVNVLHERSPLYVQMSDGTIRNGYTYKILNMVRDERTFAISVLGLDAAKITIVGGDEDVAETQVVVAGDQVTTLRMYINAPESSVRGKKTPIYLQLKEVSTGRVVKTDTLFAGPGE
jgi:polyferredoxin